MSNFWIDSFARSPQDLPLSRLYGRLTTTSTPLLTAISYLLIVSLWSHYNRVTYATQTKPNNSLWLKNIVVVHNFNLMIFSFVSFYHTAYVVYTHFTSNLSLEAKVCDSTISLRSNGLFYWGWLFYLSKYYEVLDTVIILVKGRTPSFLQSYHHAGAIIGMWTLVANQTPGAWIFIAFNSFIHSIMYGYYISATLGYNLPGKKYITYLQIGQFFLGIITTCLYLAHPQCLAPGQLFSIFFNLTYVTPLIYLFYRFAQNSYPKHKSS